MQIPALDGPKPMRSRARLRLLAAASVLAFLALLELVLRALVALGLLALPRPETVRDAWARDGWAVDRYLNWRLLPEHVSNRGGAECSTNSHGLREEEIPFEKPAGCYRILVLGDSTVLGFGVPVAARFSDQLERLLNQGQQGLRFEVINAGVPGYSLYNSLVYFRREGVRYDPDLVILETNFNDRRLVFSPAHADADESYARFYHRLRLQEGLSTSFLSRGTRRILVGLGLVRSGLLDTGDFDYDRIDIQGGRARIEPPRYSELLDEFIDFAQEHGAPVVLVPLQDRPSLVEGVYRADSLSAAGRPEEALAALQPVYAIPIYQLVVARRMNELRALLGQAERILSIPNPIDWNSTDGSILVHLSDPYVEIMQAAARREGVLFVPFDTRSAEGELLYLDYIHLNVSGNRVLAERLHALLTQSDEVQLPDSPGAGVEPAR